MVSRILGWKKYDTWYKARKTMKHIAMVMVSEPTNMWMYDVWFQKLAMILLATAQNHIGISSSEIATDTKDFDYVCPSWSMCGLQDRFLLVYFYRFTWLGMVATVTSTYIGLPWFTSIITPPYLSVSETMTWTKRSPWDDPTISRDRLDLQAPESFFCGVYSRVPWNTETSLGGRYEPQMGIFQRF
jgi:hypothetical protein